MQHECILFSGVEHPRIWMFTGPKGKVSEHVHGRLILSNLDAVQDAVLAGLGVAITPKWFWRNALADGVVTQLLPAYQLSAQNIKAVTASRPRAGSKVTTYIEFVQALLKSSGIPDGLATSG